jgi:hypothetical protein
METKSLRNIMIVSVLIIVFLAFQDTLGFSMWQSIGGFSSDNYTKAEPQYMQLFWSFAMTILIGMALVYYLIKKDISESLAIFLVPFILLQGGMEDILYYAFMGLSLDSTMPWLFENCWFMSFVAKTMGLTTVTPVSLWVSFGISIGVAILVYKWLVAQKW